MACELGQFEKIIIEILDPPTLLECFMDQCPFSSFAL